MRASLNPTAVVVAQTAGVSAVGDVHRRFGWIAVGVFAAVGVWGLVLAIAGREPGRWFWLGFGLATATILTQVLMGVWARQVDGIDPGNQHFFYGVVILFTLTFVYIYRSQMAKRPALAYGLLALFLMGLGLRAIANFGQSF
jgi:hypothetical protein